MPHVADQSTLHVGRRTDNTIPLFQFLRLASSTRSRNRLSRVGVHPISIHPSHSTRSQQSCRRCLRRHPHSTGPGAFFVPVLTFRNDPFPHTANGNTSFVMLQVGGSKEPDVGLDDQTKIIRCDWEFAGPSRWRSQMGVCLPLISPHHGILLPPAVRVVLKLIGLSYRLYDWRNDNLAHRRPSTSRSCTAQRSTRSYPVVALANVFPNTLPHLGSTAGLLPTVPPRFSHLRDDYDFGLLRFTEERQVCRC